MKNKIDIEDYVDDIVRDLPHSKYTSRFREELLEHSEDGTRELEGKNETDISKKIMQKIGSKKDLAEQYNGFHDLCFSKLWIAETIIYSIVSLPLLAITSIAFMLIFLLPFAIIANNLIYKFIAARLSAYCDDSRRRKMILIILIIPPIAFNLLWGLGSYKDFPDDTKGYLFIVLASLVAMLGVYFPAAKNFKSAYKSKNIPTSRFVYLIPLFFLIGFAVDRAINLSWIDYSSDPLSWHIISQALYLPIAIIYSFIAALDFLLYTVIQGGFFGNIFGSTTGPKLTAVFIILVGLGGLWLFISSSKNRLKKPERWTECLGLITFLSCFFWFLSADKIPQPEINWEVPAINLSEKIEKKQLGTLYPLIKSSEDKTNGLEEHSPKNYEICPGRNSFLVSQGKKNVFNINLENISSLNDLEIGPQKKADRENYCKKREYDSRIFWQEDFECKNDAKKTDFNEQGDYIWHSDCEKVTYKGKEIFKETSEDSSGRIYGIEISEDKQWAIIGIDYALFDHIYLVDLRGLK